MYLKIKSNVKLNEYVPKLLLGLETKGLIRCKINKISVTNEILANKARKVSFGHCFDTLS